jgi:hypothetical protein
MRAQINTTTYPSVAMVTERSNFDTNSQTNLSVTVTIESNCYRTTTYRASQRPDGVIVERPQYRVAPSGSNMTTTFQPQTVIFEGPRRRTIQEKIEEDLRGIRTFDEIRTKCERKIGRDGYNGPLKKKRGSESQVRMQRWLDEEGPWTPIAIGSSTSSRGRTSGT